MIVGGKTFLLMQNVCDVESTNFHFYYFFQLMAEATPASMILTEMAFRIRTTHAQKT